MIVARITILLLLLLQVVTPFFKDIFLLNLLLNADLHLFYDFDYLKFTCVSRFNYLFKYMKLLTLLSIGLILLTGCGTEPKLQNEISIIPLPQEMEVGEGYFVFKNVSLETPDFMNTSGILDLFNDQGISFSISEKGKNVFTISLPEEHDTSDRSYQLSIMKNRILIKAGNEQSVFYALQTLLQSLKKQGDVWVAPAMTISDFPRFPHRGLLLDCSRHFFSVEVVKKYIDLLSHYKMNVLHWHLTEDQGWRIAIDQYPKLTEVGAWRTEPDGSEYGGFYTKDEIREVVAYAKERYVTIIPEIELPGHSQAALAAYPELSCTGEHVEVANDWGVFKEIYCAGNEETFVFLENVLSEVMELFPSEYIHIGGDEAPKYRWEQCDKCQRRISEEGLHDEHELQSYFIGRIEKFLNKNGRKLIGWDEIMEGGLSGNAVVQSWRGMDYGRDAARAKHQVIFSPTSHAYLDYNLKSIDLKKVYSFDPIPTDLDKEFHPYVLGAEVNMWTEHVPDEFTLDQKVFPRLLALAEVAWTYNKERDFEEFYDRVQGQYSYLKSKNVSYGLEGKSVNISVDEDFKIQLESGVPNLDLFYAINGADFVPYTEPIKVDFSGTLLAKAEKENISYADTIKQKVAFHKAFGKLANMDADYNASYTAGGEKGLTDGLLASEDFRDGRWQGYYGEHVSGVIDLLKEQSVKSVSANFYQYNNAWIFLPTKVEVHFSTNGEEWTTLGASAPLIEPKERGKYIERLVVEAQDMVQARYVKFSATNRLVVPEWHEAAGSKAWLFIDEIVVK